jgi:hypothetical protein
MSSGHVTSGRSTLPPATPILYPFRAAGLTKAHYLLKKSSTSKYSKHHQLLYLLFSLKPTHLKNSAWHCTHPITINHIANLLHLGPFICPSAIEALLCKYYSVDGAALWRELLIISFVQRLADEIASRRFDKQHLSSLELERIYASPL